MPIFVSRLPRWFFNILKLDPGESTRQPLIFSDLGTSEEGTDMGVGTPSTYYKSLRVDIPRSSFNMLYHCLLFSTKRCIFIPLTINQHLFDRDPKYEPVYFLYINKVYSGAAANSN